MEYTGEELVQKWIDEKRQYISMNEIRDYGLAGKIAVVILEEKYEGKYTPSEDCHSCGGYTFKNPLGHYEEYYKLYYMFESDKKLEGFTISKNIDDLLDEIVRLEYDDIYWHHKKLIPQYRDAIRAAMHDKMYYKTRYWFIFKTNIWTV